MDFQHRPTTCVGVAGCAWRRLIVPATALAFILAGLLAAKPAEAAQITVDTSGDVTFVGFSGEIVTGDADAFEATAASLTGPNPVVVALDSPGGRIIEGLDIGENVRKHGFATAVFNHARCASTCGLIWLAGKTRFIASQGGVGFHAAYVRDGEQNREAGAANAVVGGYLSRLGLTYEEIVFFTSAPPDGMQWLHIADWQRLGLAVSLLPDPTPAPSPVVAAALPAPNVGNTPERRAMAVVQSYYTLWSGPGMTMEQLAQYYSDTVLFYGTPETRAKVMAGKAAFDQRWPQRRYTVNTNTLFAQCDTGTCSVSGVVAWDATSTARNERSSGAANFVVKLALNDSAIGGIILSENGAVLSGHKEALAKSP